MSKDFFQFSSSNNFVLSKEQINHRLWTIAIEIIWIYTSFVNL